jgi:transposase InsO family protein
MHTLETDHRNLQWMNVSCNDKVYRWACELLTYNLTVQHIPGSSNVVADALSRIFPDKDAELHVAAPTDTTPVSAEALWEGWAAGDVASPWLTTLAGAQQRADASEKAAWRNNGFVVHNIDGLQVWRHQTVHSYIIPNNATDIKRAMLVKAHEHDGHGGVRATTARLRAAKVTWTGLSNDVHRHVSACPQCQRVKPSDNDPLHGLLTPRIATGPWERVVMDHIGPLEKSKAGNKYIAVIVDPFTRWVELEAIPDIESATTANTLRNALIWRHGAPAELQTDGHLTFEGTAMNDLYDEYAIEHHTTTAYHPQSNGVAERKNKDIMNLLRILTGKNYSTWDKHLARVQWHINTNVNRTIGMSPFKASFGYEPRTATPAATGQTSDITTLDKLAGAIYNSQRIALGNAQAAAQKVKQAYDAKRAHVEYTPGEYVLAHRADREHKLANTWQGPYTIKTKIRDNVYELADVLLDNTVQLHVSRIRPYNIERSSVDEEVLNMLPEGQHIVKEVLAHKWERDELAVLVWWKGYPKEMATWQRGPTLTINTVYKEYCSKHGLPARGYQTRTKKTKH